MFSTRKIGLTRKPQTIKCYSPVTQAIEKHPTSEVLARHGMREWLHGFYIPELLSNKLTADNLRLLEAFGRKSLETEQKMAITPMPIGCTGYETVAVDRIAKNSMLLFSGEFFSLDINGYTVYFKDPNDNDDSGFSIDASRCANISRFMSDAFDMQMLHSELEFTSDEIAERVATANFEGRYIRLGSIAIYALIATRDILPGERLYRSCIKSHYNTQSFCLFDKKTYEVINPALYYSKTVKVMYKFNGADYPSGLEFTNGVLNREKTHLTLLDSELTEKPYDIYILPEFAEAYLEAHPNCLRSLGLNQALTIQLPTEEHPCVKRLRIKQTLGEFLLQSANQLLTPSNPITHMPIMSGKHTSGENLGYYCPIQAASKGELYLMESYCSEKKMGYFLSEDKNVLYIVRDDLFKQGDSPVARKKSSSFTHSMFHQSRDSDNSASSSATSGVTSDFASSSTASIF